MTKKILTLFLLALATGAQAQFTIDDDTLYAYGFAGTSPADFVDIYGHTIIRSTASSGETILWNRTTNNLQDTNWASAICDIISCRAPEVSFDSFAFANGGDTGVLSFHFYPVNVAGEGSMTVRFSRSASPLDYLDVVIMAKAWNPVGVNLLYKPSVQVFPNPASNIITVNSEGAGWVRIFNSGGQMVHRGQLSPGETVNIEKLASGVYSLLFEYGSKTYSARFIKE